MQQDPAETMSADAPPPRLDPALKGELRLVLMKKPGDESPDLVRWRVEYLAIVARILAAQGVEAGGVEPLRDIAEAMARRADAPPPPADADHSLDYARASAEISCLILVGEEEDEAAQHVARQLVARGVPLPARGGDARGWKRLLEFRDRIRDKRVDEAVQQAYREELASQKASQRG